MCAVFPTEVSCSIPNVGAAGGQQVTLEPADIQENTVNGELFQHWTIDLPYITHLWLVAI